MKKSKQIRVVRITLIILCGLILASAIGMIILEIAESF